MARIPGVYFSETVIPTVSSGYRDTVTCILGTATSGTTEPVLLSSKTQLRAMFGANMPNDYGLIGAEKILENTILYVRVFSKGTKAQFKDDVTVVFTAKEGGTHLNKGTISIAVEGEKVTVTLKISENPVEVIECSNNPLSSDYIFNVFNNYSTYLNLAIDDSYTFKTKELTLQAGTEGAKPSKGTTDGLSVETLYPDSRFNNATFSIAVSVDGKISAKLISGGNPIEEIPYLNKSETAPQFIKRFNNSSSYLKITEFNEVKSISCTLSGGNDGSSDVSDDDYIEALNKIANSTIYPIDTLLIPGVFSSRVVDYAQTLMNTRKDAVYLVDPPLGLRAYATRDFVEGKGAYSNGVKIDSSYCAVFSPWIKSVDADGDDLFLPPSILIARQMASNDKKYNIWDTSSGVKRGVLEGVSGLEYEPSDEDMKILYTTSIVNPIVHMTNRGYVIYGNKTAQRPLNATKPEVTCSLNVRRLINYLKKAVYDVALELVWEINDTFAWTQFINGVTPILQRVQDNRGLYSFEVIMDETTVTADMIDSLTMPGIIRVQPTRAAEYVDISFELYPAGVSFPGNDNNNGGVIA